MVKINIKNNFKMAVLIILLILGLVVIFFGFKYVKKRIREEKNENIKSNMLMIQGKIKVIKGTVDVDKNEEKYIGKKISELDNNVIKNKLKRLDFKEEDFGDFYLLNKEEFDEMELDISENDKYVVNYKTGEVIYVSGFMYKNKMIYTMSNLVELDSSKKTVFNL